MTAAHVEQFPAISRLGFRHGFIGRAPGIDVATDRTEALARLDVAHAEARRTLGLGDLPLALAEQVHGKEVAVIDAAGASRAAGADALVTDRADVCLGIYVADCCAVYLVDARRRVIGLAHAGRKGTELEIVPATLAVMTARYGSQPGDVTAQLSPCIRPPNYEVDFAAQIIAQCHAAGLAEVHDCGEDTAADPERFYSYRMEKGRTGRMLALLTLS